MSGHRRFAGRPEVQRRALCEIVAQSPLLTSSARAIDHFASRTHCVALRLGAGLEVYGPCGRDDIFSFRPTPNPTLDNRPTHEAKAGRQMGLWPELTLMDWPEQGPAKTGPGSVWQVSVRALSTGLGGPSDGG